ncbi:MAG: N-acetylmuramoyl-L-alanine amidase, partial [Lachnospiraceae bacterium]|nr:N-acetylmuramoyl-L-alanine amidase [Lachnospiraceae bacterium]
TASGVPEYQLTLDIGLQLRDELEARGYQVIMTRDTNEVDISNSERAAVANEADADAFIRIHANGSGNSGAAGAMTICQTPGNVYNGDLYEESRALADSVLNAYTEKTGIDYEYVWETDTMSGINWCRVPVTILEMGYMTNSEEDLQMQDSGFQEKMTDGIADGIDAFMADRTPKEH